MGLPKWCREIDEEKEQILKGWHTLQEHLPAIQDPKWCLSLLKYEIQNKNRGFIVQRISSRIVKLLAEKTRRGLDAYIKKINENS